ncbi:carbohydrate ABC transporter permease [Microbacterium sp. 1P10AE]|uniref:carbohydrate ABC transporter permease n=1 Tax=Microbacterium sp. 1P10AE TaxID=3132286 RepID=UPI00399F9EE9
MRAGRGGILKTPAKRRRALIGVAFVAPALALYGWLILGSFGNAVQYSLYDWNGVGKATFVGFSNYLDVFTSPARLVSLLHAFELMVFFCGVTLVLALAAAVLTRAAVGRRSAAAVRTILFMPQVIPIVAAAVGWSWIYSREGALNQILDAIGLGGVTRAWLGDPNTALPAVGFIGTWALLGLVTMMLTAGISKIDSSLYEAARLDGANAVQEFFAVTLPGLRRELVVSATLTIIAALASFDIVYITTQGGPNRATIVPGIDIYNLAFGQQQVGGAAAMGIVLMGVVLLVIIPLQRLAAKD